MPHSFNLENKITWLELAPSLQELFKNVQSQIVKERERAKAEETRIEEKLDNEIDRSTKEDTRIDKELTKLAGEMDLVRGASFKSWSLRMWETFHIFTDFSFYELFTVTQSGNNSRITDKRYGNVMGLMNDNTLSIKGSPVWIKHQIVYKGRIYLGCMNDGLGADIYRSDEDGLKFEKIASIPETSIWDFCEYKGNLYCCGYSNYGIYKSTDGLTFTKISGHGGSKVLCNTNAGMISPSPSGTIITTDGSSFVNWGAGVGDDHVYSRYKSDKTGYIYVGTCGGPAHVSMSKDNGKTWTTIFTDSTSAYIRWICSWQPLNNPKGNIEYVVWGTGGSGTEIGTACLYAYDPTTGTVSCLFDFRGDGSNTVTPLNKGHAPIEPMISDGSGGYKLAGFRERQIRYIETFINDITGESFLIVGTSDSHFYKELADKTLYYQEHDYSTHVSTPLKDSTGSSYVTWNDYDKEAWHMTDTTNRGDHNQYGDHMGNVYVVSPRNPKNFRLDDLCIALVKHTEDTRVYSMCVFTDTKGVKWAYAGTGGGNYSGKGLLYRFEYSSMLDIVNAAKVGAIFPPRWKVIEGVNKHLMQIANRYYLKIMGGVSGRDDYAELKFAFGDNFLKSTEFDPYVELIFNHAGTDNYYSVKVFPLLNKVCCYAIDDNVEQLLYTKTISGGFKRWATSTFEEETSSPRMGPYYILAGSVQEGAANPDSKTSADYYLHDDLDGKVVFYFKESMSRDDLPSESDAIFTYTINYPTKKKKIGNYGVHVFDFQNLHLISMKQMSLAKYRKSALEVGEIVFAVR